MIPAPPDPQAPPPSLQQVVDAIEAMHPLEWAQPWDAVGLVAGDPTAPVRRIHFAVDPVEAVVEEAVAAGADLLVTHHPLLLRPVNSVAATTFKGRVLHRAIRAGLAIYVAHTNADAGAPGVSDALARVLDLDDLVPLDPLPGRPDLGIGRVGTLAAPERLADFADRVAGALPDTEQGVRVAGDLDAPVQRVAVCGGSGDSLFEQVRASGADVYVTADLRHHPASEARERAVFAEQGRPFLVDVAHWASEWPWLAGCADRLVAALAADGRTVDAHVSTTRTDPWTLRVPSRGE
ncbi:Nif3-like dinuclear metal center hexameric protein [Kineococcus sp. SYSU DK003]|uniref:Nif3-like dinuclear metal center hexameric protein n=1 Tax=Kineococcus sp. SYSU DK003 TaxID=3383124 RepID=UPI003D7E15EF